MNTDDRPAPFSCSHCPDADGMTAWFKTAKEWEDHLKGHGLVFTRDGRLTKVRKEGCP